MIIVNSGSGTVTNINTALPLSGGPITTSGTITTSMATNKLIGRSTAGTGEMEEITVGTGLSLTGGTLSSSGGGAAGSTNQIQFNNAAAFAASANLRWIIADNRLVLGTENTADTNSRMVVIGKGISTQNTFVVHNSTGTNNALVVRDDNFIGFGTATQESTTNAGTNVIRANISSTNYLSLFSGGAIFLGAGASGSTNSSSSGGLKAIAIGNTAEAFGASSNSFQGIAIGNLAKAYGGGIAIGSGSQTGTLAGQFTNVGSPIAINALSNSTGGSGNIAIGSNAAVCSNNVVIGRSLTISGNNFNNTGQYVLIGHNLGLTTADGRNSIVALGSGAGTLITIPNSFQIYLAGQAERSFFLNSNGNIVLRNNQAIVSATNFDANATNTITINNGTAPATNIATSFQLYSANISGAGTAAPHFRNENGNVIKIYQETTGVASATFVQNSGSRVDDVSTFDGYTIAQVVRALRNQGLLA